MKYPYIVVFAYSFFFFVCDLLWPGKWKGFHAHICKSFEDLLTRLHLNLGLISFLNFINKARSSTCKEKCSGRPALLMVLSYY